MTRSNFYLMLGLSFDPPEERMEEIKRAIEKKQHEWSRGAMDFKKGPVFREYMALLPEIQRVMSDPVLRKKEAEEASFVIRRLIVDTMAIVAKRGYLYEAEVSFIADKCQTSKAMVEKVCQLPIKKGELSDSYVPRPQDYDHFQVFLVYLEALHKIDYYDFIRIDKPYDKVCHLSTKDLLDLVNKINCEKGKYTSTESASEKLCAECKRTFSSEEGRKAYDEYLQWKSVQAVYEQIEVATRFTKVLEKEQREESIKLLMKACGHKSRAEELLKIYMEKEHISEQKEVAPLPITKGKGISKKSSNKPSSASKEVVTRADYLYPTVVKIREEMCELHYEEASMLLKAAVAKCGELPELMRIEEQLTSQKQKLFSMINRVNEQIEKRYFFGANQEFVALKNEFPKFHNQLIETKINNGLLSAKNYFEQAKASKQEEVMISACMDALEMCTDYPGVVALMEKYPPRLSGTITVTVDSTHHCNYIHWNDNNRKSYIHYCVMRKKDARPYHKQDGQILMTLEGNSYVDETIVPGVKYFYAVYAVRLGVYSNALITHTSTINYCEVQEPSILSKGNEVWIGWQKVPMGATVEVYKAKGFVPAHMEEGVMLLEVTVKGCIDRKVEPGNIYGYRVYTVYQVNGEKHYSDGIPLRINMGFDGFEPVSRVMKKEKVCLNYYFEVKKLFLYPHQVILHIQPTSYLRTIPPLLIVGSESKAPLFKTSGKVIAMLPSKEVKEEFLYTIKVKDIGGLNYLNVFLQRDEDEREVRLTLKTGESLCISQ